MSLKVRNYLFLFFIVAFFLLSLYFSLYASGYQLNLSWPLKFNKLLQKTGMLNVDTLPTGANIYLNGKIQTISGLDLLKKNYLTTPAKIRNLLPGEYLLRLEKVGYWPLERKITINPNETTFAEDLNLFLANDAFLVTPAQEGELALSPNGRYLYLTQDKKIWNLKNNTVKDLTLAKPSSGEWLTTDKLSAGGFIFNPEKNDYVNYEKVIGPEASAWYFEETTGRLYYKNKNSLNLLDYDGRALALNLLPGDYLSYEPRGDHFFLINLSDGKTSLQNYNLKTQKIEQEINLPSNGNYYFVYDHRPTLSLFDEKNKTLYLLEPNKLSLADETLKNVISWQWINDQELFYNNPWEIYYFDLKTRRSYLVTRVSEAITKIIWHKTNNYLIFSGATSLNVLDFKTEIITKLIEAKKIMNPVLDEKNNLLYFWAEINSQPGVYKILLQ